MKIASVNTSDRNVLQLFSQHDDFMMDFLGEDKRYYTRYSENERLERVWIAYLDDVPAGCVAYRTKDEGVGEIKRLFVRGEYRGKGIARGLLEAVERHARERGCHKLFLDTRITLEPAVSIYRRFGFSIVFQQGLYIQMEKGLCMDIQIKPMETEAETRGKAYVHWKAWQEAYAGLVDPAYLDRMTLEKCTDIAFRWPDNLLVAKDGDRVIGFAGYGAYRDDTMPNTGEVYAIYILKDYYDRKIGYSLMRAAIERLTEYERIAVWVLEGNARAIRFYEKCGFKFDGTRKEILLGTPNIEIRMVREG